MAACESASATDSGTLNTLLGLPVSLINAGQSALVVLQAADRRWHDREELEKN